MTQKVALSWVAENISKLVSEGLLCESNASALCQSPSACVRKKSLKNPVTKPYYPTKGNIKNHVYQAKQALQLSKLDQ